jgi:hypothetical protein
MFLLLASYTVVWVTGYGGETVIRDLDRPGYYLWCNLLAATAHHRVTIHCRQLDPVEPVVASTCPGRHTLPHVPALAAKGGRGADGRDRAPDRNRPDSAAYV